MMHSDPPNSLHISSSSDCFEGCGCRLDDQVRRSCLSERQNLHSMSQEPLKRQEVGKGSLFTHLCSYNKQQDAFLEHCAKPFHVNLPSCEFEISKALENKWCRHSTESRSRYKDTFTFEQFIATSKRLRAIEKSESILPSCKYHDNDCQIYIANGKETLIARQGCQRNGVKQTEADTELFNLSLPVPSRNQHLDVKCFDKDISRKNENDGEEENGIDLFAKSGTFPWMRSSLGEYLFPNW